MKAAGREAERLAAKPSPALWAALIHGEDEGVVGDTARSLIAAWSADPAGADVTTLEEDDVRKAPARLFDGLEARALLGGDRIIRVRTRGDKIAGLLLDALETGEAAPGRFDAKLVILADALAKKSKLRAGFESAKTAAALHVFADETGDVAELAKSDLAREGVEILPEALDRFAAGLPGHRALARAEIEKLALFGRGLGRPINVADVRALTASDVDHAVSDLVAATLSGDGARALEQLDRLMMVGTSEIAILRAFQREALRMLAAHRLRSSGGGDIGMKLRPPVWRSHWPAFEARLKAWSPKRLAAALERLYDVERAAKQAGPTASPALRIIVARFAGAAG